MKKIDKDGIILCEMQASVFAKSADRVSASSDIFIRRFMNSRVVKLLDSGDILQTNIQAEDIIDMLEQQYGMTQYGSVKYAGDELYWMGYLYRYYAYTYGISSLKVYKILKPKELRGLFSAYHTMDPAGAIERILEAKNLLLDDEKEQKRQYEIFRKIRQR